MTPGQPAWKPAKSKRAVSDSGSLGRRYRKMREAPGLRPDRQGCDFRNAAGFARRSGWRNGRAQGAGRAGTQVVVIAHRHAPALMHLVARGPRDVAHGSRTTLHGRRGTSPLTQVHRPRARYPVDVVDAPAYDPTATLASPMFSAVELHQNVMRPPMDCSNLGVQHWSQSFLPAGRCLA